MKKILSFLLVLFLTGCFSQVEVVSWDESEFYEFNAFDSEDVYYFQYPRGAVLNFEQNPGYFEYKGCSVNFGDNLPFEIEDDIDLISKDEDGIEFESWLKEDVFVLYSAFLTDYGYYFWVYDGGDDVVECMDLVEGSARSFTDNTIYVNDKYSFSVELFSDFKIDKLPSSEGVLMKKWFEQEDEDGELFGYKVEMVVYGFENVMGFSDISEFVSDKYPGYNLEFSPYSDKLGVFVDEALGEDAVRHYFFMGDDSAFIYEAYLKVPSLFYGSYKDKFDSWVSTIEVF